MTPLAMTAFDALRWGGAFVIVAALGISFLAASARTETVRILGFLLAGAIGWGYVLLILSVMPHG